MQGFRNSSLFHNKKGIQAGRDGLPGLQKAGFKTLNGHWSLRSEWPLWERVVMSAWMHFQWFCPTFHCFCALPRPLSLPQAVPFLFFSGHSFKSLELSPTQRGGPAAALLPWQCFADFCLHRKNIGEVWAGAGVRVGGGWKEGEKVRGGRRGEEGASGSRGLELGLRGWAGGGKRGAHGGELRKAAGIWGPLKNKFVILHTAHVWKDRHFWRPREESE